jgi:hypothetical protein
MDTRGKRLKRWYYVDIERALADEGDREEAIFGVPEDRLLRTDFGRIVTKDYSTRALECQAGAFPLRLAFDEHGKVDWLLEYIAQIPNVAAVGRTSRRPYCRISRPTSCRLSS